jgi:hypothetical protein
MPAQRAMRLPTATLAMAGVWITILGFGLLTFDAAIGILAIPAGIVLAIVGMPRPRSRDEGEDR